MPRGSLKERGQQAAMAYLERVGLTVVEHPWRCDAGVIDVIALDGGTVVFVSVSTVKGVPDRGETGASSSMVRRVGRIAETYITQAGIEGRPWRFDRITLLVVAEDRALLRHHKDALAVE